MKSTNPKLRKKAERLASKSPLEELLGDQVPQNIQDLVYELRIHQLELEIQNEELLSAQTVLNETKNRYFDLYHSAPVGYCTLDEQGNVLEANQTASRLLGRKISELVKHKFTDFISPLDQDTYYLFQKKLHNTSNQIESCEVRLLKCDGVTFWSQLSVLEKLDSQHNKTWLLILVDISERKLTQDKLQLAASVFDAAGEAIMITDIYNNILDVNPAFTQITGYSRKEVIGKNPRILSSGEHNIAFYKKLWMTLKSVGSWKGEMVNRRKNGELYNEILHITSVCTPQGELKNYVGLFSDNSDSKKRQATLETLAHFDLLTGLPNRVLMADRLSQAMIQTNRTGLRLVVAFLDLDGFKVVNDTYGHDYGDQLLIELSKGMHKVLRGDDTLARIGGDEFVAILPGLANLESAIHLLNRLLEVTSQAVTVKQTDLQVSASLGVTYYPQAQEVDAEQLLRQADQAMYQAKLSGKNHYVFFNIEQNDTLKEHYEAIEGFREAFLAEEFELYYQPKINMRNGDLTGVEALIRWHHPSKGILTPIEFLPHIEDHPLAIDLGEWVIHQALKQLEVWDQQGLNINVSVNIDAYHLMKPNFANRLKEILNRHPNIKANRLEIEILETRKIEDIAAISTLISACKAFGVSFALDDFGTGYSSLTYLKQLPIKLIKIDQSFVKELLQDVSDLAILQGVISLAAAFQHDLIAEGVETLEHGEILLQLGCDHAQGYAIAQPMPPEDFPVWLASWTLPQSWQKISLKTSDEIPLLFAGIEHRAWVTSIESFINSRVPTTLPLSLDECHLSHWINTIGDTRYRTDPNFIKVKSLHKEFHQLATEIIGLHRQNKNRHAAAKMPQLNKLKDVLTDHLKRI